MSGCSCGGAGPIVIKCGSDGAAGGATGPGTDGTGSDGVQTPPEPPCDTVIVRFETIHVTNSGALVDFGGAGDEPWELHLNVNGRAAAVPNPLRTQDGDSFAIGAGGDVTVPLDPGTILRVACTGVYNPDVPWEGHLPSDVNNHGSADNWGVGASHALEASDADRAYEVHYSIDCITRASASIISRSAALQLVHETLNMPGGGRLSEDAALSLFLTKIGRHGFTVKSLNGDDLVVEGPTDIHRFIRRLKTPITRRRLQK
jgi:hypothetical protein